MKHRLGLKTSMNIMKEYEVKDEIGLKLQPTATLQFF